MTRELETSIHGDPTQKEKRINEGDSLSQFEQHLYNIYNRRDSVWLPGRDIRYDLFQVAHRDLTESVRKNVKERQPEMLARTASRVFCIARAIEGVSLTKGLFEKYSGSCSYCGLYPCQCREKRPQSNSKEWNPESPEASWSIREWQQHLDQMYGEKNKQRGIEYSLLRLFSEVSELRSLERKMSNMSTDQVITEYTSEVADCMAWTLGIGNVLNINVEESMLMYFGDSGCRFCHSIPCQCARHNWEQIDFSMYESVRLTPGLPNSI